MKHAVIFAHPRAESFTATMAGTYAEAARTLGHAVLLRDLYRMDFNPVLAAGELPFAPDMNPGDDVKRERELLRDADVFALFYPLWLAAPPAMVKGYLERVFGYGFAYGEGGRSAAPLLAGRSLISFTSSGAPLYWLKDTGMFDALRTLFDRNFAELCGLTLVDHIHSGGVVPGASGDFVAARQAEVREAVRKYFGTDK